jgi:hypothetical protein
MAGPDTSIPIGVYREGSSLADIQAYEAFLGMPAGTTVSFVLDFMPDKPTWAQFEAGALAGTTNGSAGSKTAGSAWGAGRLGPRRLMLAVPACVQGSSWATEASGGNDAHWRTLGASLVGAGLQHSVLRIGRELNGGWYPWTAGWSGGNTVANYLAGYQHVVSVLRSVPGAAFTFMWNPTIGVVNGLMAAGGVEQSFPGSGCVDVVGLDIYDGDWTGIYDQSYIRTSAQQLASFDKNVLNCADGLTAWQKLADGWGKPVGFPEWGLRLWNDGDVYHGGGDDPVFITEMATWIKGHSAWMHAFWEDTGGGVMDPDESPRRRVAVPQSRQAFLTEFGWS